MTVKRTKTTVAFYVKDPDALYCLDDEAEFKKVAEEYSKHGEYFLIEVDLVTKQGRMLPRSEWKRHGM